MTDEIGSNVKPLFKGIDARTAPQPGPTILIDMRRLVNATEKMLELISDGTFFDHREEARNKTVLATDEMELASQALREKGF